MKTGIVVVSALVACWLSHAAEGAASALPTQEPSPDALAEPREQERQAREEEGREREEERRQREEEKLQQAEERYEEGTEALDENQWDRAVKAFEQVCRLGGRRCDGALYWKAYSLHKRGRRVDAQAAIAELRKTYPASRWLGEAKALEQEMQQQAGRAPSPEQEDDEELKLLALDSLLNTNAERALPLLLPDRTTPGSHPGATPRSTPSARARRARSSPAHRSTTGRCR